MQVNILGIIISTIVWFIIGSILYNPKHPWGKAWADESGMGEKMAGQKMTPGDMIFTFGGTLIAGALAAGVLSFLTHAVVLSTNWSWLQASLMSAVLVWLGFYGGATFVNTVFSGQSKKLIGINLVNGFLSILAIGIVTLFFPVK